MSAADDPPGGDPEKAKKQAEAILRQRALGRELRSIYNQYADEPVPSVFDDLLDQLERDDGRSSPEKDEDSKDGHAGRSNR